MMMNTAPSNVKDLTGMTAFAMIAIGFFLGAIFLVVMVARLEHPSGTKIMTMNIQYVDLISIILTAVSVIVTALGVIIAIVTIYGYNALKKGANEAAIKAAVAETKRQLADGGALKKQVIQEAQMAAQGFIIQQTGEDNNFGDETTEYGE